VKGGSPVTVGHPAAGGAEAVVRSGQVTPTAKRVQTDAQDHIVRFIRRHANTRTKLAILLYFTKHPQVETTAGGLANRLQLAEGDVAHSLQALHHSGLVATAGHVAPTLYRLCGQRDKRQAVLRLVEWWQRLGGDEQAVRLILREAQTGQPSTIFQALMR
jgi:hypothetical protein